MSCFLFTDFSLSIFFYFFYRFFMSCFLFTDSILRVGILRVIVGGKFLPELNCPEDIFMGKGFSVEMEPGILALFKKRSEIKQKRVFSTESKEQLKTNRNYYVYEEWLPPPQYLHQYI